MSALSQQNNKRIAKNTLRLFSHAFRWLRNLYTSRVDFDAPGVEDYGIYNAV